MKFASQPNPNEPVLLVIEDIFRIKGCGTCITGRVQSGMLKKGDPIEISGKDKATIQTKVSDFEGFIRDRDSWIAQAGDNCAILLREVEMDQLDRGMIVTKVLMDE
jgi:elongation factor Tu